MSDPTPGERAITNAIDDAIRQYYQDEYPDDQTVPAGWVLLVNDISTNTDSSGVVAIVPNGNMPWAMIFGIIEMARAKMHAYIASPNDEDD